VLNFFPPEIKDFIRRFKQITFCQIKDVNLPACLPAFAKPAQRKFSLTHEARKLDFATF